MIPLFKVLNNDTKFETSKGRGTYSKSRRSGPTPPVALYNLDIHKNLRHTQSLCVKFQKLSEILIFQTYIQLDLVNIDLQKC